MLKGWYDINYMVTHGGPKKAFVKHGIAAFSQTTVWQSFKVGCMYIWRPRMS